MKILAVDSSSATASVAILEKSKVIAECFINAGLTHSQTLAPMIDFAFKTSGISVSEIDVFAVTCGPGSFTGLRIGISTVKAMAFALGKPCVPISTLYALAFNSMLEDSIICACLDARREQLYNANFKVSFSGKLKTITRLTQDRAVSAEFLAKEIKNRSEKIEIVGDGSLICYNNISVDYDANKIFLLPEHKRYVKASNVALAAEKLFGQNKIVTADELNPMYIRESQAERLLAEGKLNKGGVI